MKILHYQLIQIAGTESLYSFEFNSVHALIQRINLDYNSGNGDSKYGNKKFMICRTSYFGSTNTTYTHSHRSPEKTHTNEELTEFKDVLKKWIEDENKQSETSILNLELHIAPSN